MKVWLVFEEYVFAGYDHEKKLMAVFSEKGLADDMADGALSRSVEEWEVEGPSKMLEEFERGYAEGYEAGLPLTQH